MRGPGRPSLGRGREAPAAALAGGGVGAGWGGGAAGDPAEAGERREGAAVAGGATGTWVLLVEDGN